MIEQYENGDGDYEFINCPHCGQPTSGENLNCIYCGELLKKPLGVMSGLIWGWKGWLGLILVLLVLLVFLLFLL